MSLFSLLKQTACISWADPDNVVGGGGGVGGPYNNVLSLQRIFADRTDLPGWVKLLLDGGTIAAWCGVVGSGQIFLLWIRLLVFKFQGMQPDLKGG